MKSQYINIYFAHLVLRNMKFASSKSMWREIYLEWICFVLVNVILQCDESNLCLLYLCSIKLDQFSDGVQFVVFPSMPVQMSNVVLLILLFFFSSLYCCCCCIRCLKMLNYVVSLLVKFSIFKAIQLIYANRLTDPFIKLWILTPPRFEKRLLWHLSHTAYTFHPYFPVRKSLNPDKITPYISILTYIVFSNSKQNTSFSNVKKLWISKLNSLQICIVPQKCLNEKRTQSSWCYF